MAQLAYKITQILPKNKAYLGPQVFYRLLQRSDHGRLRLGILALPFHHQPLGALLLKVVQPLQVRLVQEQLQTRLVKVQPAFARTVKVPDKGQRSDAKKNTIIIGKRNRRMQLIASITAHAHCLNKSNQ